MAKIILAAVAALCALVAVSGVPALGEAQQQQMLSAESAFVRSWPTDILKAIEQALQALEDKIQQMSADAEDAVKKTQQLIEDNALELANKWNARLQEWVDKANQTGVDVSDCLNGQDAALANVVDQFKVDSKQCLVEPIKSLDRELQELRGMLPEVRNVLQDTTDVVNKCNKLSNPIQNIMCLTVSLPSVQAKVGGVSAKVLLQVGVVAAKAAALQPSGALCTATAYTRAGAQGSAIVDATVGCIKGKLNAPSQLY